MLILIASGTWTLDLPLSTACREYFFYFLDSSNNTWLYPETGALLTNSEGDCSATWQSAKSPYNLNPSTTASSIDSQPSPVTISNGFPAGYIALIVIVIAVVIAAIAGIVFWRIKKAKQSNEEEPSSLPMSRINSKMEANLTDIEVKERLGGGNFSEVYRGIWQVWIM